MRILRCLECPSANRPAARRHIPEQWRPHAIVFLITEIYFQYSSLIQIRLHGNFSQSALRLLRLSGKKSQRHVSPLALYVVCKYKQMFGFLVTMMRLANSKLEKRLSVPLSK